jgi:hypothetical protein
MAVNIPVSSSKEHDLFRKPVPTLGSSPRAGFFGIMLWPEFIAEDTAGRHGLLKERLTSVPYSLVSLQKGQKPKGPET